MAKWVSAQPSYATEFKNLHRNYLVKDIIRYKEIAEDGRTDAIPPIVFEFCKSKGTKKIAKIETILKQNDIYWSEQDVVLKLELAGR